MKRNLIIVRTHRASQDSLDAYDRFKQAGFADVIFAVDERRGPVDMLGRDKIGYDAASLSALGLYVHANCGWRCGDYNYHVVRQARPDYDFYWLIEPDVRINAPDLPGFFAHFDDTHADFLAPRFGPRDSRWIWSQTLDSTGLLPHGGLFPITRASGTAIDHVLKVRQTLSQDSTIANDDHWPNDESMMASALATAGFACHDLNHGDFVCHTPRTLATAAVIDYRVVEAAEPDGMIYHPVREFDAWLTTAEIRCATQGNDAGGGGKLRAQATHFFGVARACLGHPVYADAALVPLMLAQSMFASRPWARTRTHATGFEGGDAQELQAITRALQRRFGAKERRPRSATAHLITGRHDVERMTTVGPADFDIGEGFPLGHVPTRFLLPFAYDFEHDEMLLTAHVQSSQLLTYPFLYAAQRKTARVLVKLPMAKIAGILDAPPPPMPPVFVLSLGRTGSTLLEKLIGCVTARSISEPDIVTQLAAKKAYLQNLPKTRRHDLIHYAIAPFFDVHLSDDTGGDRCVIKFRSQVNNIADLLAETFPTAKFVFMLRDRHAWALSTFRAFNLTPARVVERMLQGLRAMRSLHLNGVDLTIIRYEDLVADPMRAVLGIAGPQAASIPDLQARVDAIMSADSQADHRLARTSLARDDAREAAWLKEFDEAWQQNHPTALLNDLGLVL